MMKISGLCLLLAVFAVTSFVAAAAITNTNEQRHPAIPRTTNRKILMDNGDLNLDDYGSVDPSPSSKAVMPGPIQHGSPLIPYIPRSPPSPPSSPTDFSDYPSDSSSWHN